MRVSATELSRIGAANCRVSAQSWMLDPTSRARQRRSRQRRKQGRAVLTDFATPASRRDRQRAAHAEAWRCKAPRRAFIRRPVVVDRLCGYRDALRP